METTLVAGRECGGCTVCCTVLAIDQPELQKAPGEPCVHCTSGCGCAIYQTRPRICRTWFCGWRNLPWMGEALRPDRSHILVHLTFNDLPAGYVADVGLEVLMLDQAGLRAAGLAETLGHAVRADIATFLHVPSTAGYQGARVLLNEDLRPVAQAGQGARLLRELEKLYAGLRFYCAVHMHDEVILSHRGAQEGARPQ
jgi:hypothetical protein